MVSAGQTSLHYRYLSGTALARARRIGRAIDCG